MSEHDSNPAPLRIVLLRAPVLTMVLAATAIPIELRHPDLTNLSFTAFRSDIFLNILGYLPLGIVLATVSTARVVGIASTIATLVEASQFFMMHRQPSALDVLCNVMGAALGAMAVSHGRRTPLHLTLDHRVGMVAVALAAALLLGVWSQAPQPLNERGWTAPGRLEADWKFDETRGGRAIDSSGHDHSGTFPNEPTLVPGILGNALRLDGRADWVDAGRASGFRLVGSMSITAWIRATSFPPDDAAIVSTHNGIGYQLDTTIDRGPRTIGFKLGNACGQLMARYGATPLVTDQWYHVAGVYDAPARTLNVYLNGRLDNGSLQGTVTTRQLSTRESLYIGRRSNDRGNEFAGLLDEVRIYSLALTNRDIEADMQGKAPSLPQPSSSRPDSEQRQRDSECPARSDSEDSQLPGAAGVLGVLVAVMCLGFWPTTGWIPAVLASGLTGLLLLQAAAPSLPLIGSWLIPLTTLAGTISVIASLSDQHSSTRSKDGRSLARG